MSSLRASIPGGIVVRCPHYMMDPYLLDGLVLDVSGLCLVGPDPIHGHPMGGNARCAWFPAIDLSISRGVEWLQWRNWSKSVDIGIPSRGRAKLASRVKGSTGRYVWENRRWIATISLINPPTGGDAPVFCEDLFPPVAVSWLQSFSGRPGSGRWDLSADVASDGRIPSSSVLPGCEHALFLFSCW